jgi:metal-responsive CopG/Arc/MetJ family transcriptional regulator
MRELMSTVNFSIPDDVKEEFGRVFDGRNKSAIIAELMRKAIAEVKRRKQREELFRALTEQRAQRPLLSDKELQASRAIKP